MKNIYWCGEVASGKVGVMSAPGLDLDGDIINLKEQGVHIIVSLLTQPEINAAMLGDEGKACTSHGVEFHLFSIPDQKPPQDDAAADALFSSLYQKLQQGNNIAFHCLYGIGRAPSAAACMFALDGIDVAEAFQRIAIARTQLQVTSDQIQWVRDFKERAAG